MPGFLGMRGTGDWATDERPLNWRKGILYLYPNGMAPLTAILSMMGEEKVDDPQFHWWTKTLATQGGAITNIYTDVGLTSAYASGGVAGDTLYVNVTEAVADEWRVGHVALMRYSSDYDVDCVGKVTAVLKNGASSYIAVKLLEDDDNSSSYDLSDADRVLIIGNMNAEGAVIPDALAYDPTKWYNYSQIFRTPLEITRTARRTRLRTADAYKEAKREALELHSIEMEKAYLWGIRYEGNGSNGKPERTTMGLIPAIKTGAPSNVFDYSTDAGYSGQTWLQGGEEWLDAKFEQVFRYGAMEKLAFCGSGALLGIQRLAKSAGQIMLKPRDMAYGLKIVEWITPFGTIFLKTHPLFSFETTNRNTMVVFEPKKLKYKYIDDTTFYSDKEQQNTGHARIDGTKEEYLTECGLEYHHPTAFGYFNGLNEDNVV